jgi:hypothetical protein
MITSDGIMEENMDRFERVNGILIDKNQVKLFIERLTHKYGSWEIEDILNSFINKDIEEFEQFITGEREEYIEHLEGRINELEKDLELYKIKGNPEDVEKLEKDYLRIIQEQKAALNALGAGHLKFGANTETVEDRIRPWRADNI